MFDRDIPVYLITGFLESGKTTFMNETLMAPYFRTRGRTLVIACEQGEVEYDAKELRRGYNTDVVYLEDVSELTTEKLKALDKQHKPERVIVEFNPLWSVKKFYEMTLPKYWDWAQHIVVFDASCYQIYSQNMMPLITEMISGQDYAADMVIFNRATPDLPLANFRRSIKVSNRMAQIMFEGPDGNQINIFQDEMPFDLKADVIAIEDDDFGIWYVDMMDNFDRYLDRRVRFKGQVLKSKKLKADFFVPSRKAMTCCADDIQFIGYVCQYAAAPDLNAGDWVTVEGTIKKEYSEGYHDEGPVVHVEKLEKTDAPQEELVYFT